MNRWHFAIRFNPAGGLASNHEAWVSGSQLMIEFNNLHPAPRRHAVGKKQVFIFGNPIADGVRDDAAVMAALGAANDFSKAALELNGSFLILIHDPEAASLRVINDRFAALTLYCCELEGVWHASSSLKWLREHVLDRAMINEMAVAEFIFLRRLLGEKTLQSEVRYLASASILRVEPTGAKTEKYWAPDYSLPRIDDRELSGRIAATLTRCLEAHLSDGCKTGLLLSGGLDSRALLAAAPHALHCLTTCLRENNESEVAREVSDAAGAQFSFVPRPVDLYEGMLDDAVFLTSGQQIYTEAQFLGYEQKWPEETESFLIGLGLDIFYGGLYLPKENPRYLGRPALHFRLKPLEDDLAAMYLSGVGYRMKQSDPNLVVKKSHRPVIRETLLSSVNEIMDQGQELGAEGYDLWEFMHLHNLSRHYSFPMMMSIRTYADCRAPALDNEIFDLSIRMSAAQKVNGTAYQMAITQLAPELMKIRNANTNLPASMPLPRQTATKVVRYLANKLFDQPYPVAPGADDRSWPSARESLLACPSLVTRTKALPRSDYLASVPFIDMDGVKIAVGDFFSDRHDHAVLMNVLLTLDAFLRPVMRD